MKVFAQKSLNFYDILLIQLIESNLAPNAYTIAESKFETHHHVREIYKDDEVIGMLSYCYEDDSIDTELYWLFRFMLDKNHQEGIRFKSIRIGGKRRKYQR